MRHILIALALLAGSVNATAGSQVSVSIGINVPAYPVMQRIPNYPVYYAPAVHANYFFYDGLYWVFDGYDWYASSWYNGPWYVVDRFDVPAYVLRVPVRYYRAAPAYFSTWRVDAAPRWDVQWGATWAERRAGWNTWNGNAVVAAAPLPTYQRAYSGTRYPQVTEQVVLQSRNYSYQPRDVTVRQRYDQLRAQAPVAVERKQARVEQQARVAREQRVIQSQARVAPTVQQERVARADNAPPAHAQAKGWPGKGHDKERVVNAPPTHAQAKGWPGKGHDKDGDGVDDHENAKGRGHNR